MKRNQAALFGGLFIGILSALPVVSVANACCCLWVVVGGGLTFYLMQQNRPVPVESGEAVLGGLLSGVIGALLHIALTAALFTATGPMMEASVRNALEANSQVPPEMRDAILNMMAGRNLMLIMAGFTLPMYAIFAMLGALLGMSIFKKKAPSVPPPPVA